MIQRAVQSTLLKLAKEYPVVAVVGPRQSGKSTVVQAVFPGKPYVTLEDPDVRLLAQTDPRRFLGNYPDGAIFDEIQNVPELLSYIQGLVDALDRPGLFILTGSHQLMLHQAISQSLAGRVALLNLLPLSFNELAGATTAVADVNQCLLSGFFPRIHAKKLDPTTAYRNYLKTYIERDIRQLINVKDLSAFQRFLKLCAGRIGSVLVINHLANEVGVSHHTIRHWISILEVSFIIFLLPPYYESFGKRVVKSPKLYFFDVGLASYLLDIHSIEQVNRDPLRGGLFENMVVMEWYKASANEGSDPQLYYYRDAQKNEVDLIYKTGNTLVPIEIKSSETLHHRFFDGLDYFMKLSRRECSGGFLIYAGEKELNMGEHAVLNYRHVGKIYGALDER